MYSYIAMWTIVLFLKTNIPASILAVSSPFSLLVSSFAKGPIQADILLSHDSIANLV